MENVFCLSFVALIVICFGSVIKGQSQNRDIDLGLFFTDTIITGNDGDIPEKCAPIVLASRLSIHGAKVNDTSTGWTIGIKPTVSLSTALLIFLGVGLLAVIIATVFQMVSYYF
jgi:hypothetical protein